MKITKGYLQLQVTFVTPFRSQMNVKRATDETMHEHGLVNTARSCYKTGNETSKLNRQTRHETTRHETTRHETTRHETTRHETTTPTIKDNQENEH
jgi:ribosome-binding protein aMBF1 (putative translation factor)